MRVAPAAPKCNLVWRRTLLVWEDLRIEGKESVAHPDNRCVSCLAPLLETFPDMQGCIPHPCMSGTALEFKGDCKVQMTGRKALRAPRAPALQMSNSQLCSVPPNSRLLDEQRCAPFLLHTVVRRLLLSSLPSPFLARRVEWEFWFTSQDACGPACDSMRSFLQASWPLKMSPLKLAAS